MNALGQQLAMASQVCMSIYLLYNKFCKSNDIKIRSRQYSESKIFHILMVL